MQALLDELTALRPKASAAPRTRRRYVLLGSALVVCVIGGAWRISGKRSAHSTHVFPREPGAGECPRGKGLYCAAHGVDGESATLYRCAGGTIIEEKKCNVACMHLGRGAMDACDGDSPACPFGGSGVYCGFNYLSANPKTLYRCSDGKVTVEEECRTRCIEAPDRVEDHCE